ncbi:MAG: type IV pilus assembly protein PilM [Verrucomicrobiota bacterium]|nr:type IV pilus assembly protein PilM [Verrucomicrobiota bacterium]
MSSKSFLTIDMGAGTLRAAEFEPTAEGGVRLLRFGVKPLGLEGSSERARPKALEKAAQELWEETGFTAKRGLMAAPGFQVLSKPIRLPAIDKTKVAQLIKFEAQQNIPFPLEEAAWDHYTMGVAKSGEIEVLLSALKSEVAEGMIKVAKAQGTNVGLVDTAQAALVNAFRYNYDDIEGCSLVLDIGAKTTHALFFEGEKFFIRTINIGANSITQEFATETKMRFSQAEEIKLQKGLVGLGGAYAEPDDPHEAALSKIARQVLTRLHVQINQTLQFWQKQQGGSNPVRVFLHGGATIMPYLPEFLAEKLSVPIEYFNPFVGVEIDQDTVDVAVLEKVGHTFGQIVGLAIREVANCPLEMNLMPGTARIQQDLDRKKPYFYGAAACLVGAMWIGVYFNNTVNSAQLEEIAALEIENQKYEGPSADISQESGKLETLKTEADQFNKWISERFLWADVLQAVRQSMIKTELEMRQFTGENAGVWVAAFNQVDADEGYEDSMMGMYGGGMGMGMGGMGMMGMNPMMMQMYGMGGMGPGGMPPGGTMPAGGGGEPGNPIGGMGMNPMMGMGGMYGMGGMGMGMMGMMGADTNNVKVVGSVEKPLKVVCKAIDMRDVDPTANNRLITVLVQHVRNTGLFDYKETKPRDLEEDERMGLDDVQGDKEEEAKARLRTYLFGMDLVLREPIEL